MKTLKNVLLINAVSSGATGIGLIVFASSLAEVFGVVHHPILWVVGIFLVSFAILVLVESRKHVHNLKVVRLIIGLDVTWVLMSLIIVVLQLFNLSMLGYFVIGAVAIWVAGMAYLQMNGVKENIPTKV